MDNYYDATVAGIWFGSNIVMGNTCTATPREDFDLWGIFPTEPAREWNCVPWPVVGEPPTDDLRPFIGVLTAKKKIVIYTAYGHWKRMGGVFGWEQGH